MSTGPIANVTNGVLDYNPSVTESESTRGTSDLGKDAFLQLLVCQMQNQDPLNPSTDTEYVSQLAQFSQLEQLQNLSSESEKSQAFSLVGKYVIMQTTDSSGNTKYDEGVVDFVNVSGSDIKISIDGSTFDYEDLYTVVNDTFYMQENIPKIEKNVELTYNALAPVELSFDADFGKNEYGASEAALVINGEQIDSSHLSFRDGKVIIDADAFKNLENGTYAVGVVFNNSIYTTVNDKVTLTVYNSTAGE